jgi:hypothetical protein
MKPGRRRRYKLQSFAPEITRAQTATAEGTAMESASPPRMRLGLPTVGLLLALAGAVGFGAGQSFAPESRSTPTQTREAPAMPAEIDESNEALPPGHPPVDQMDPAGLQVPPLGGTAPKPSLEWQAPERWQLVPNASTMRLATYRVPRAPGDAVDAELSITQAGGSVEENANRWIGQFDTASQKSAKRAARKVGPLDVTWVEVQGTYSGGMVKDASSGSGWALLGAIVSTPGMPHFFKLTGPAKSVLAARGEFDSLIASLALR